jgi:hypothetical protein
MKTIKQKILDAVDPHIKLNDTFRLMHEKRIDGTPCSQGKDPCLSVKRTHDGWVFYCHRCKEEGFISDKDKSPKEVRSMIEKLRTQRENKMLTKITLPFDFIPMCKDFNQQICDFTEGTVPWAAYHWMWKYDIKEEEIDTFNIGWSPGYNRVIIPIYEYGVFGKRQRIIEDYPRKLVGWIGREVECSTKEERRAKKIAKYITRKEANNKRIFFVAPFVPKKARHNVYNWALSNMIVIVEDAISAMKIWKATGATTVALLNTNIDNSLMRKCQGKKVVIWLDRDARTKAIGYASRFNQFGIDVLNISTGKDPKAYNQAFIAVQIKNHKGE